MMKTRLVLGVAVALASAPPAMFGALAWGRPYYPPYSYPPPGKRNRIAHRHRPTAERGVR
jgi:hypothetical protein